MSGAVESASHAGRRPRHVPLFRFIGYYIALAAISAGLALYVPAVQRAFISPIVVPGAGIEAGALLEPGAPPTAGPVAEAPGPFGGSFDRGLTTALVSLGLLALVMPVAWVYMYTRRFRYDRALVQSVIILPLVVAGMVMIVKNSLALAFSLAGIVAAVRFRNTLQDPRDAVYIFLSLGLGLAAGVQALDIALVMSLSFNLVVLALWRYNFGAVYSGDEGSGGMLTIGDPTLRQARTPDARREFVAKYAAAAKEIKADGILLVHGVEPGAARTAVESALSGIGKDWTFTEPTPGRHGIVMLPTLVRFKKKGSPTDLLAELDEYWASHVAAAEYVPFTAEEYGDG